MASDVVVERNLASRDQSQDSHGGEQLADGSDGQDVISAHGHAEFDARLAHVAMCDEGVAVDDADGDAGGRVAAPRLDQAVDALMGAAYGSAGERCMAISVAVPVGERDYTGPKPKATRD